MLKVLASQDYSHGEDERGCARFIVPRIVVFILSVNNYKGE